MTNRLRRPTPVLLVSAFALAASIAVANSGPGHSAKQASKPPLELEEASLIIEVNATDGDAGLQPFLDGEPWRSMKISDPGGKKILDVDAKGRLRNFGLTELFSETHEPSFDELPLARFLRRFPAGEYDFAGRTTEGRKLVGSARLSHDIPDGPEITSPDEGEVVSQNDAVARWNPVAENGGIDIAGYQVIVEREDPLRTFEVKLPASVHSVTIPPEYLQAGTEYKIEVLAIERSGNQTIEELEFETE
jgi:Fibronectin type III domain